MIEKKASRDGQACEGKSNAGAKKPAEDAKLPRRKAPRKCSPKPDRFGFGIEPLPKR